MVVPYREDDINTAKIITNSEFNRNIIDQDTKSDNLNRHDTDTNTNELKNVQNTLQIILSKLKKEEHRKALEKRTNKQERYSVKQMSDKKKKTPVQETFYFEAEEQDPENAIMNNEDQLKQI